MSCASAVIDRDNRTVWNQVRPLALSVIYGKYGRLVHGGGYLMKLIIIGGDAAGMSAASRAKRNLKDWDVTVFEKTFDVSFSACGMPYNIADVHRPMDDLVVREARVFREKQGIDLKTGHCVDRIDPEAGLVFGYDRESKPFSATYDKLLIASGASPIVPNLPGFDLEGVLTLKNLQDGRIMKDFVHSRQVKRVVIIGMGYIALEMCEALRSRDIEVNMVKPGPVFLPWMNPELSGIVRHEVERHGVGVFEGHPIRGMESTGRREIRVVCEDLQLDGQMVLVAVGVKPNSELAADAGLTLGPESSIAVDKALRTSNANIFAAGDCADAYHVVTGSKTYIPLALRANRSGWAVADVLSGKEVQLEGVVGTTVFKVFDLQVARTGLSLQEALDYGFDPVEVTIQSRSRAHAHPGSSTITVQMVADRRSARILGAQMVGIEGVAHRINAVAVALHQKMTVHSFSQCDLAYAPPFSPVWDPTLTAANQLLKQL